MKVSILGCGRIGTRHASHVRALGTLTGVCDLDQSALEPAVAGSGAKMYSNLEDMLADQKGKTDLVSVCTPNGLHAEHTIRSLESGFHVLCEKPMALSSSDCGDMIQAAERSNRRLFVVKQNRFNPPVVALKALIDEGRLGTIQSVQMNCFWNRNANYYDSPWKGTKLLDGGTLYTQFSHFIDLLYWLFGDVDCISTVWKLCSQGPS